MVLEKGVIPPNANFKNANPNIDTELLNIKVGNSEVSFLGLS
jgi:acyl transferase domain-containing protein